MIESVAMSVRFRASALMAHVATIAATNANSDTNFPMFINK